MTLALISTNPTVIIQIFQADAAKINIPGKWQVDSATAGWESPDGAYKLVAATGFVAPTGQIVTGDPSYAIQGDGSVIETFKTVPAPAPSLVVPGLVFLARLEIAEYTGVVVAAQAQLAVTPPNGQLSLWLDMLRVNGEIDVLGSTAQAAKSALVTAGLLTQDRADVIFS